MDARTFLRSCVLAASVCCSQLAYSATAPCDLLTQSQVSTAVGKSVGAASAIANTGCSWSTAGAPKITVSVSMQNEKMFASAKGPVPPNTTKASISGVGDEAIFLGVPNFSSLWVRKGTSYLLVRIYGVSVSEAQTKLKDLASAAVSKL